MANPLIQKIPTDSDPLLTAALVWDYPEEERGNLAFHLMLADSRDPPGALWAAMDGDRRAGSCAVEIQPGKVGYVTGPMIYEGESAATGDALLQTASDWSESQGVLLLQSLLPSAEHPAASFLLRAGFEHTSDLLYLVVQTEYFPVAQHAYELSFEPYRHPGDSTRLEQLVARTYVGSLDCPQNTDPRSLAETLAGYAGSGSSGTSHWFFLQAEELDQAGQSDVGCLLLADYEQLDQWELVYVGLAPEVRGRGWGLQAVRHAQELVRAAGRKRLVLAVDEANRPAVAMYAAVGFEVWNRRAVFLRKIAADGRK